MIAFSPTIAATQSPALLQESEKAAGLKILGVWRKHLEACLKKAQGYIADPENLSKMKRAVDGNNPVYFPQDLPQWVLKKNNSVPSALGHVLRSDCMLTAQILIKENRFEHLVVPQWRCYGGFLIEQRLPIQTRFHDQIALYLDHREEFSEAIKELAEFFCQSYFSDLMDHGYNPLTYVTGDKPRYDNLPLYMTRENGVVRYLAGLIDLEHFTARGSASDLSSEVIYDRLHVLVQFFPYHLEAILEEISQQTKDLFVLHQKSALKFIKIVYEDYLKFLRAKNITCANPNQVFEMNLQRREELLAILSEALNKKLSEPATPRSSMDLFLETKAEEKKRCLASALPSVLDAIIESIQRKPPKSALITELDLLSYRGVYGNRQELLGKVGTILYDTLPEELFSGEERRWARGITQDSIMNDTLIQAVFEEWVKGGEMYYYNPCESSGGHYLKALLY